METKYRITLYQDKYRIEFRSFFIWNELDLYEFYELVPKLSFPNHDDIRNGKFIENMNKTLYNQCGYTIKDAENRFDTLEKAENILYIYLDKSRAIINEQEKVLYEQNKRIKEELNNYNENSEVVKEISIKEE